MKTKLSISKPKTPIRDVLAANLKKWMAGRIDLDTQMKVAERSGVGQTSIGRIVNAQVSPTLDVLEQLATAFDRDVSELIARPETGTINFDRARYAKLPDYEKQRIEGFIQNAIDSYDEFNSGTSFKSAEASPEQKQAIDRAIRKPIASKGAVQHVGGTRTRK